jgi:hypothetical protein
MFNEVVYLVCAQEAGLLERLKREVTRRVGS